MNWRELNHTLSLCSETEVLRMLDEERIGKRRVSVLVRLHQRYNSLRVARERIGLLKTARQV